MARARKTRRRWPPDKAPIWRRRVRHADGPPAAASTHSRSTLPGYGEPEPRIAAIVTTSRTVTGKLPIDRLGLRQVCDDLATEPGGPPSTVICPDTGRMTPAISLSSVLLPARSPDHREERALSDGEADIG